MLTPIKKTNVLLYGNIGTRSYRSQILIQYLLDSGYSVLQINPNQYKSNFLLRYLDKIGIKFSEIYILINLLTKAAIANVIYIPPGNTHLIKSATWVADLFNKKLILEVHTSLYDSFVRDKEIVKDGSKEAKELINKDKLALTKPDYIIHPSAQELNYWEKLLGININKQKVFIAPLCSLAPPVVKRSFMQDNILKICWWGTFIPLHGIDNILQAMRILKERELPFTCNLFGVDGSFFHEYAKKIKLKQLEEQVFLRKDLSFSDNSLPNYLVDNCDLSLGIFGNTVKAYHAVPNKLVEALSIGIPTLTMNSPALTEFFNPETDFWVCEPAPEAIAESILTIASGTAYPVDWEQTRQKVLSIFSVARYQEVVSKVLERATDELLVVETAVVEN